MINYNTRRAALYAVGDRVLARLTKGKAYTGTVDGVLPYDTAQWTWRYRVLINEDGLGLVSVPEASLRRDTLSAPPPEEASK